MLNDPAHNAIRMQSGRNTRIREASEYAYEGPKQQFDNPAITQSRCNSRCNLDAMSLKEEHSLEIPARALADTS